MYFYTTSDTFLYRQKERKCKIDRKKKRYRIIPWWPSQSVNLFSDPKVQKVHSLNNLMGMNRKTDTS